MKKVIYDCDNTMGMDNRDIDDGMALVYLSRHKEIDLLGITCTYGNSSIDDVFDITTQLVKNDLSLNVPVFRGRGSYKIDDYYGFVYSKDEEGTNYESESISMINDAHDGSESTAKIKILQDGNRADKNHGTIIYDEKMDKDYSVASRFIVEQVRKYPGEITILATGSMQNLYDAWLIDNEIVDLIDEVVVMGGVSEPLMFGEKEMKELNFSVCSEGAFTLIDKYKKVSIHSANNCMRVKFGTSDLEYIKYRCDNLNNSTKNTFLIDKIKKWMEEFKLAYDYDKIVLWDIIAAVYLTDPDLFVDVPVRIFSDQKDLETGYLMFEDTTQDDLKVSPSRFKNGTDENTVNTDIKRTVGSDVNPSYVKNEDLSTSGNIINLPYAKSEEDINRKIIDVIFF